MIWERRHPACVSSGFVPEIMILSLNVIKTIRPPKRRLETQAPEKPDSYKTPSVSGQQGVHGSNHNVLLNLTTLPPVVTISNMNANLMLSERHTISETAFVELVVWRLPLPLPGSCHGFKYRLALVVSGTCVLRYDNEAGKGDHKHIGQNEIPYDFTTPKALLDDFWNDVDKWRY